MTIIDTEEFGIGYWPLPKKVLAMVLLSFMKNMGVYEQKLFSSHVFLISKLTITLELHGYFNSTNNMVGFWKPYISHHQFNNIIIFL